MNGTTPSRARRPRTTRWSVRFAERLSTVLIAVGGIGTILSVSLIFFFLVWVVRPLFLDARVEARDSVGARTELAANGSDVLGVDPHAAQVWHLMPDGVIEVRALDSGQLVARHVVAPSDLGPPSVVSVTPTRRDLVLGFPTGEIVLGELGFEDGFLTPEEELELPDELQALGPGGTAPHGAGLVARTPAGELRITELVISSEPPVAPHGHVQVVLADVSDTPSGTTYALLTEDERLSIGTIRRRYNMLLDRDEVSAAVQELPYEPREGAGVPRHLILSGLGKRVFLVWGDGVAQHYQVDGAGIASLVETVELLEDGRALEAAAPLLGKNTLLVSDDAGGWRAWFAGLDNETSSWRLVPGHELPGVDQGVISAIQSSPRSRVVAAGTSTGEVLVQQITTEAGLGGFRAFDPPAAIGELAWSPREDLLLGVAQDGRLSAATVDLLHPEATFTSLFERVWYEGYVQRRHSWQSIGASDDFEPKFGLTAIVFGTLKATLYSMLFGAPMALLAAIFTSEYLRGRTRATVKSVLELMASLPSVVLGFVAAILVAPMVQRELAGVLLWFLALPVCLLLGAYLWQLLPRDRALRWSGTPRLLAVVAAVLASIVVANLFGPWVEAAFFAGDLEAWLGGRAGGPTAGWVFLLLPLSGLLAVFVLAQFVAPRLRSRFVRMDTPTQARVELAKIVAVGLVCLAVSVTAGFLLGNVFGIDPRGSVIGAYDQRNALVVGFVMGFAIVPIIYTLSEDALTAVPQHLREASLGTGATPWQTAQRVVIPIAASGLFSAMMIGLGRAVGETMIVLMATGGTPILDWNVFNGFRTLSANIATELPEAVVNSTHYRVLFFAGFLLFLMTFVLNTLAEVVRQRYRKRAFQL